MSCLKKTSRLLFLVCLSIITIQVQAQKYTYRHYGVEDGLASSEVYQVFQDRKGNMWFATDMGISRFNGNNFTNFDISNGLPANTVFEIFEDQHGKVWFLGMGIKLSYYLNDTILQYHNPGIEKYARSSKLPIKRSFYIDANDNIYFSVLNQGILKLSANGDNINLQENDKPATLRIVSLANKLVIGHNKTTESIKYIVYGDTTINKNTNSSICPTTLYFAEKNTDGSAIIFTYYQKLFKLKANKITKAGSFKNEIIWFSKDKKGRYWVSIRGEGIYCYLDDQFNKKPYKSFLTNKSVSSVLIDKENGYWFPTLANGVFYLPDEGIKTIPETKNRNILDLSQNDEALIISDDMNELFIFDNHLQLNKKLNVGKYHQTNRIIFDPKLDLFWMGTYNYVQRFKGQKFILTKLKHRTKIAKDYGRSNIKSMALSPNKGIWLGSYSGINLIHDNWLLYQSFQQDNWNEYVYDIICNDDESLWLGTYTGLWKYTNGEYIYYGKRDHLFSHRISALLKSNGKLYVGTNGAGLLIYDFKDKSVRQVQKTDGLNSNVITDIVRSGNNLWLSTNNGLNVIKNIDDKEYSISKIRKSNGLLSNEVKRLFLHAPILYIAGKKGVNYLNINKFSLKAALLNTNIEKIAISGHDTLVQNKYFLNYKQNNISISYKAISYKTGAFLYRYKMYPISQKWTYTNKEEIQFTSLAPGSYTFMVSAKNQNGKWNDKIIKTSFEISKPFWQTWWFVALILALVSTITIASIHYKLQQVRKENKLKDELNLYMKKAINAQINPHFLFNSLNSINQYILKNDKINSSKYLNRFAAYMRSILNALKSDMQNLSEELKISGLYLELEQLRLKEKLNFNIIVDKSLVTQNILVPSMIITPFLENAIWYGILPKKGTGLIDLSIRQKGQKIIIRVKDDGIGRKEHMRLQQNPKFKLSNPGPENTLERINLINKLYPDIVKIVYTDIDDGQNNKGTVVDIVIRVGGS